MRIKLFSDDSECTESTLLCLDSTFAEYLKHQEDRIDIPCTSFPPNLSKLCGQNFTHVKFCISSPDYFSREMLYPYLSFFENASFSILSNISLDYFEAENFYEDFQHSLLPFVVDLSFCCLHSYLLCQKDNVSVSILASKLCRSLFPTENIELTHLLTHQLLSAVTSELSLDISENLYSLGIYSRKICDEIMLIIKNRLRNDEINRRRGTLYVIDRVQDISMALSFAPNNKCSMSHRIFCNLLQREFNREIEVSVSSSYQHSIESIYYQEEPCNRDYFSALAKLSLDVAPSICFPVISTSNLNTVDSFNPVTAMQEAVFFDREDVAKSEILKAMKLCLSNNSNQKSSKKMGFGAELFFLITSLLFKDSTKDQKTLNLKLLIKFEDVVRLSLCIIESMQRSSQSQFAHVYPWKTSFDIRCERERLIFHSNGHYLKHLYDHVVEIFAGYESTKSVEQFCPLDCEFTLLMLIRILSFPHYGMEALENSEICRQILDILSTFMVSYCCANELSDLRDKKIISSFLEKQILDSRCLLNQAPDSIKLLVSEVTASIYRRLRVIVDCLSIPENEDQGEDCLVIKLLKSIVGQNVDSNLNNLCHRHDIHDSHDLSSSLEIIAQQGINFLERWTRSESVAEGKQTPRDIKLRDVPEEKAEENPIVIFFLGGISALEVAEVYQYCQNSGWKSPVYLMSNNIFVPDDIFSVL